MPHETRAKERLLHADYWERGPDGAVTLLARQCRKCGACYLPAIATCVTCRCTEFQPRPLPASGRLYTYTVVRGSGGVWPDVYTIGYVDFPDEQVRVCGQVRETGEARLEIGMAVGIEDAVLYTDANGTAVRCFRFHAQEAAR